jgi:hypothetical protein
VTLLAHGIGSIRDLPVPAWLFLWGGAVVLVLSFLALGTLWKRPQLERRAIGKPLPPALERFLRSTALRIVLGAVSFALLVLVFLTALLGEPSSAVNLAPTFVYVVFWLGVPVLQVLLGNVWSVLNPWRAAADAIAWLWDRLGRTWEPLATYPERLGVYPGAVLLFAFAVLELAYTDPANPRALALAIALYSYITWFGMATFGRESWNRHGDAFSIYFELLSRAAPFGERDGRLVVRMPFSGLAGADPRPGVLVFVAVMLGSVAFDGLSRTTIWQDLRARVEGPYVLESPGLADLYGMLLAIAGLVATVAFVCVAYLVAVRIARAATGGTRPNLVPEFLLSLVPIALVYAVAHYFTSLIVQGQYAIPLASDPFGYGWDVLGTIDFQPNLSPFAPNTIWYLQVGALVAGHVAGLAIAHDRAVTLFPPRPALRSQYAMLALMVLYTVAGMWLLSQD